ncbi:Pre-mRNA-splicing factor [Dissophora globulifera]|uniref:Pre-mRNA-splicing factor n=1 Tax=Dissophora globulifera TaxID=979702 RepID=A0A9P6RU76_9FUNG|nr:Pre-mRNA-splicing factor [Dissophora globulifera]
MSTAPAMSRPARRQVTKEKVLGPQASVAGKGAGGQPGQTYNIYYDRWTGGGNNSRSAPRGSRDKAAYRCDPAKDYGRTRGTFNPNAYFCAFFAKGCCPNGEDCNWLHRIPTHQDQVDTGMDIFGRDRFDEHRDDLGGVGSMRSDSRTLYVGRIQPSADMQAIVERHFKVWGEIERVKVLTEKGVAFVTYQSRLNAEFAKEAMADQSLDRGEIVNIRWATEDPNPKSQAMNKRKAVEVTRQAIVAKLPADIDQAEHLPGSEEAEESRVGKRQKQVTDTQEITPELYLGADGQYYYDYGEYGYNHDTQQYDPARLGQYQGVANGTGTTWKSQPVHGEMTLQDRVKASLLSSASSGVASSKTSSALLTPAALSSTSTAGSKDTANSEPKPVASALGALASYGSDTDSDGGD